MLAFEFVASFLMGEVLNVPLGQDEIFAVVLGMAACAFEARTRFNVERCVQPFSRNDAPSNFSVAGQALEGGLSGREFMTIRALGYPIDRLVGPG